MRADAVLEQRLRARLRLRRQAGGVARVDVLQPELAAVGDEERAEQVGFGHGRILGPFDSLVPDIAVGEDGRAHGSGPRTARRARLRGRSPFRAHPAHGGIPPRPGRVRGAAVGAARPRGARAPSRRHPGRGRRAVGVRVAAARHHRDPRPDPRGACCRWRRPARCSRRSPIPWSSSSSAASCWPRRCSCIAWIAGSPLPPWPRASSARAPLARSWSMARSPRSSPPGSATSRPPR